MNSLPTINADEFERLRNALDAGAVTRVEISSDIAVFVAPDPSCPGDGFAVFMQAACVFLKREAPAGLMHWIKGGYPIAIAGPLAVFFSAFLKEQWTGPERPQKDTDNECTAHALTRPGKHYPPTIDG